MMSYFPLIFLLIFGSCECGNNYHCEFMAFSGYTSDESLMGLATEFKRVGRSEGYISASLNWAYDIGPTDTTELKAYRSSSGHANDYVLIPYGIPKQPLELALRNFYPDYIYRNSRSCSNLPNLTSETVIPWPRGVYNLTMCQVGNQSLPEVMLPGFYRVEIYFQGQVDWGLLALVQIRTALF